MGACCSQREGMSLLEYQSMPSLRDVAHGEWLFVYIYYTAAGNFISSQLGSSYEGKRYSTEKAGDTPLWTKSQLRGHSPQASQAGRRVGPAL